MINTSTNPPELTSKLFEGIPSPEGMDLASSPVKK